MCVCIVRFCTGFHGLCHHHKEVYGCQHEIAFHLRCVYFVFSCAVCIFHNSLVKFIYVLRCYYNWNLFSVLLLDLTTDTQNLSDALHHIGWCARRSVWSLSEIHQSLKWLFVVAVHCCVLTMCSRNDRACRQLTHAPVSMLSLYLSLSLSLSRALFAYSVWFIYTILFVLYLVILSVVLKWHYTYDILLTVNFSPCSICEAREWERTHERNCAEPSRVTAATSKLRLASWK